MATGDQADFVRRLKAVLPNGWFPPESDTTETPVLTAILSGPAWSASWLYSLIGYAKNQTRIKTATDVWLDIISQDYFGDGLPRLPGETDGAFSARIIANLLLPANTRSAILAAVESVTGNPARMIEPWQPNDNARYGSSFYGYNRAGRPGQYANGNQRYAGLVVCSLPSAGIGGMTRRGYGGIFYTSGTTYAAPAGSFYLQPNSQAGEQLVFDAINRLKPVGTSIFVKFVPADQLP